MKTYYLGRECSVVSKINDNESLIEINSHALIWSGSSGYGEYPEPDYVEPEFTSIIVNNKYLSEAKNSILDYVNKIESEAREKASKIVSDAKLKRSAIENEIRDLSNSKKELAKKYKDVGLVEDALGLVMRDRKYYLHLDNYHPRFFEDKDFTDDDHIKAIIIRRNRYNSSDRTKVVVSQYSDGSSNSTYEVKPCDSIEEVRELFGEYFEKLLSKTSQISSAFIAFADKIGFKHEAIEKKRTDIDNERIINKLKEIDKAKKNLERLNSQL